MSPPDKVRFTVPPEEGGRRLDQVLAAHVAGLSRRKARVLLDIGGVFVDGSRVKVAGRAMRPGQEVVAHLGGAFERSTKKATRAARERDTQNLPAFDVVHEDPHLLVVYKPAGLLTAPTPESDRNNLLDLLRRRGGGGSALLVHRLDLQTSGILVFAKTPEANRALAGRFREHDVTRAYLAVVYGVFPTDVSEGREPIGGRRAQTHFEVLERIDERTTLMQCRLMTGRTHQIRIHAAGLGHPVRGDSQYGRPREGDPPRMALHATELGFVHPASGEMVHFVRPLPEDLSRWLDGLRAGRSPGDYEI